MNHPEYELHKTRWNFEFKDYINSKPKEIETYLYRENIDTREPEVNIYFKHLDYDVTFILYWCDYCNEPIAWRKNFHGKQKKRCETCRKEAIKVNSRKSSKTYRDKNKIKTTLEIPCKECNQLFVPIRSTKKFCSVNCRVTSYRKNQC